jgi:molybdopterin synthase sulfur carrier subunit
MPLCATSRLSFPSKLKRCREARTTTMSGTRGSTGSAGATGEARTDVPEDSRDACEVRVRLPGQLRELAGLPGEVLVDVGGTVTQRSVLDALEGRYPVLKGTIRDRATAKRRPFIRFYACQEDYSNAEPDATLPDAVARGVEPFFIVGAMAGG